MLYNAAITVLTLCGPGLLHSFAAAAPQAATTHFYTSSRAKPSSPPVVSPSDDHESAGQGYLNPAPEGIDARYSWTLAGGDGAAVGFVDLEGGWDLDHEDLVAANITVIAGDNVFEEEHGTAAVGIVLMVDNKIGGVGIAPKAAGRVVSWIQNGHSDIAAAVARASTVMDFGDVLLLEMQVSDTGGYLPAEVVLDIYQAIRLATQKGIVVVAAGGNGFRNLDDYEDKSGKQIFNRSSKDFRDSGAILVGASSSTAPHWRMAYSNHGSRIDVYAWGENVLTTKNSTLDPYTHNFSGTSSAAPIVAGAVLLMQGLAQTTNRTTNYRGRLSPEDVRKLLIVGGTPSQLPEEDLIGVMPNVRAIIEHSTVMTGP